MKSTLPIAIIAAGIILAGAVYLTLAPENLSLGGVSPTHVAPLSVADHVLGSPTAPVLIIEYSDFDCPYCKTFNGTLHQLVRDYAASGKVAWVFRNFPLTELHPNAKKHAVAAECVAKTAGNDVYWKFSDKLFAAQPADPTKYAEYAQASGASALSVADCINQASGNGVDERIAAERQNAIDAGAPGTPYTIILVAGRPPLVIDAAWGYADLKDQIDGILKTL